MEDDGYDVLDRLESMPEYFVFAQGLWINAKTWVYSFDYKQLINNSLC